METMAEIIGILQTVIRLGIICRVVMCLLSMCFNNDETPVAENKKKMKNAVIILIISECVWFLINTICGYYGYGLVIV